MSKEQEHEHEFFYYLATNENGWKCCACEYKPGEPPGFDPARDRDDIGGKVSAILHDMHDAGLVYLSNSSHGEGVEYVVTERCQKRRLFDQYSIARFILEELQPSHAKYWKGVSRGVLTGKDPRHRCRCGVLATIFRGATGEHTCSAHRDD